MLGLLLSRRLLDIKIYRRARLSRDRRERRRTTILLFEDFSLAIADIYILPHVLPLPSPWLGEHNYVRQQDNTTYRSGSKPTMHP